MGLVPSNKGNTHVHGKLVSFFEPHTEVIRKGKAAKPTEFGKMVKIQEAEAQIITHYVVYGERPSDCDLLLPAIPPSGGTIRARLAGPANFAKVIFAPESSCG